MDLVSLVRGENICKNPRWQGRAQVHVLPVEDPVLKTLFLIFRFQDRNLKVKYMNLCTSLPPGIFADVLATYQGHKIHRELSAEFQA